MRTWKTHKENLEIERAVEYNDSNYFALPAAEKIAMVDRRAGAENRMKQFIIRISERE